MKYSATRFLLAFAIASAACIAPAAAAPGSNDATVQRQFAEVRQATRQYHDVTVAEAAGYESTHECVPGMGIHYVNWALVGDPAVDHTQPEVLLYLPSGNGLRLVAVEWFKLDADDDATTAENIPLFDTRLHGPMTHGLPLHYDLHAWVWQGNPDGILADHNPNVVCP